MNDLDNKRARAFLFIKTTRKVVNKLNRHLNDKKVRLSRMQWILEAIDEKMKREMLGK